MYIVLPVYFIKYLKLTITDFGVMLGVMECISTLLSGDINGKLVSRLKPRNRIRVGYVLVMIASLFLSGIAFFNISNIHFTFFVIGICQLGGMFIFSNLFAMAVDGVVEIAGYESGFYSLMQIAFYP